MRALCYNVRVLQSRVPAAWTTASYGVALALSGAAVVRWWRPERSTVDIAVTAAAPWLLAPSWVVMGGAVVARRRGLAGLAAALAGFHAACVRPRPRPALSAAQGPYGPELRVAFANLWCSNRDASGVLSDLADGDHDVLALAEVTDDHVPVLDDLFPPSKYPWRRIEPEARPGSKGMALVSRVPLSQVETWWSQGHPQFDSVVTAEGARPFRLLVVHTWGPLGHHHVQAWRAQLAEVGARAQRRTSATAPPSSEALPTVMLGDFNATRQHRSFERLVGPGWSDAGALAFGGWRATWPANRPWCPALFRIDHVLAGPGVSVLSGRAGRARGSDHRPVSAVLRLPPAPGGVMGPA